MISAIVHLKAEFDGYLPLANGYLLLAAVKRALCDTEISPLFYSEEKHKNFTLSGVVKTSFWDDFDLAGAQKIQILANESLSFRITFLRDEHFEMFKKVFAPQRLTLGGMGVSFVNFDKIRHLPEGSWKTTEPATRIELRFVSPVGFKNGGRQNTLPTPFAVYNSLISKWQNAFGQEFLENLCAGINLHKIMVDSFNIHTESFLLKDGVKFRGCVGKIAYCFDKVEGDNKQKALNWLSQFAYFSGVGYKTTQGMGQVME